MSPEAPLSLPDPDTARRLHDVFQKAGFTSARPLQLAGIAEKDLASRLTPRQVALGLYRTASLTPLEALTRLFVVGQPVPLVQARQAVAPTDLAVWEQIGLLAVEGDTVRARLLLAPVQGLVFAADPRWATELGPQHVMPFSPTSHALARLTIRQPVERALDLGTGCGVQALLAAAHARHVVATDANPRAVHLAALNARLNGLENIEMRLGDLFEPVRDLTFDLIVSNPPFVISPEASYQYRDAGLPDDELGRTILRQSAALLRPGGYCQFLCEWVHLKGEAWPDRLAGWVADAGCDVWVMRAKTLSAGEHAEEWAIADHGEAPEEMAARIGRWAAYYEQRGIEAISSGFVTLRRRPGPNWLRIEDAPLFEVAGDAIVQGFALRDQLEQMSDDALLGARLRIAPSLVWEQRMAPTAQGWAISRSRISLSEGLGFAGSANQYVIALLDRCRGEKPLGEALGELQAPGGGELPPDQALAAVRQLIEQGFLLPADG